MEKALAFLLACCMVPALSTGVAVAQIPNAGFEMWVSGDPVDWLTTNSPPDYVNVTQSNDHHDGSFALQGEVISFMGFPIPVFAAAGPDGYGFPVNSRPSALHGWYKFTSVSGDFLIVTSAFRKNGMSIGGGSFIANASAPSYIEFVANTFWGTSEVPDTGFIAIQIANAAGPNHLGSTLTIDDLVYGAATDVSSNGVGTPLEFSLGQNFPNPFNPSTTIRYEIPRTSHVTLNVFNMLGEEVATLVDDERTAGTYVATFDGSNLPSGTYFYRLQAGGALQVKKLTLLK